MEKSEKHTPGVRTGAIGISGANMVGVAQLVERLATGQTVVGSEPTAHP